MCTILFLYLLSLLLADISDSKRELFAWGLAVFTASLSGLCAFFDTGMPQVVLIFAGAFLFVGTLILGIVTLSERMDAAFYVSLLLLLILYAWGYVWGRVPMGYADRRVPAGGPVADPAVSGTLCH